MFVIDWCGRDAGRLAVHTHTPFHALLQEFIRVGYYVNTEYEDEALREIPPEVPKLEL